MRNVGLCIAVLCVTANCSGQNHAQVAAPSPASMQEIHIDNSSVEKVDRAGRPIGWAVSPPEAIARDEQPLEPPIDGIRALGLKGLEGVQPTAYVALPLKELGPTRGLRVSALARVSTVFKLYLSIQCKIAGKEHNLAFVPWPACENEWTRLAADVAIPADADFTSFRIVFWYRGAKDQIAYIDDVHAYLY